MPLSYEEKKSKLLQMGLDPNEYTYDDPQEIGTSPSYEGAGNVVEPPVAPKTSALGSMVSGAAQSLLPTIASMGGVRLGLQAPGLWKIPGAIIGGLGAGYLANKAQSGAMDAILPESIKKTLSQQQEEHDKASLIGELAPQFLFGGPGGIVGELGKIFTPATISRSKLGQAAIGSGLQTGMEGYREYKEGKGFDPAKLGISALVGTAQNEPTTLGRKVLGLPKVGVPAVETFTHETPTGTTSLEASPEDVAAYKSKLQRKGKLPIDVEATVTREPSNPSNALNQQEGIEELRAELQGKEIKPSLADDTSPGVKEGVPPNRPQTEKDYISDPGEKIYQEVPEEESIRRKISAPGLGIEGHATEPIISLHETGDYRNLKDRKDVQKGKMYVKMGPQYNSEGKRILSEAGPGETLSEEQLNKSNELAQKRGVTLQKESGIISHFTNKEARGYAIPDERVARVNPNLATSDTPAHEIGHNYINDLRNSTDPRDVAFFEKGVRLAGGEENLVETIGKRVSEIENKPLRTWLEDASNYVGSKVGLAEEDVSRGLARRLRDDRPYFESPEFQRAVDHVNKVYSEGNTEGNTSSTKGEETKGTSLNLGPLKPVLEDLARYSPKAAKGAEKADIDQTRLNGKFTNNFIDVTSKIKEGEKSMRYIWEKNTQNGKSQQILSPRDKALLDGPLKELYKSVHPEQIKRGLKIDGRDPISNPNRWGPYVTSDAVMRTLLEEPPGSAKRQKLINDYFQFKVDTGEAKTTAQAKGMLDEWLRGFSGAGQKNQTAAFNALRKAEGSGIPWSWMEKDPVKAFKKYGNRVSRDLAYWTNIENDPEVSALFGHTKKEGVEPVVSPSMQTVQKRLTGQHTVQETTYSAIEHFVRSLLLGPATGIKNTVSTFAQILPYTPLRDLPKVLEAFASIKKGFKDSMEMGVNRHSITGLETGDNGGLKSLTRFADNLKHMGDIIRKYTGSNAIEQWTRAHNMALGEILTESYWGRAAKGDIDARKFLRMFAPDGETLDFRRLDKLPDNIKLETAARFVERVQGTYGLRGLPSFLLEPTSPVFWFMSLAKWSTEKANVITKDVIGPALKGDVAPLLRYSLGGLFTGEAIRAIGEELMNKKVNTPDLKELQDKGGASDYAYKLFELSSLAGLGGLYSDLAKAGGDLAKGYATRGYNIPSAEIAKDITTEIGNASQAISEGQKPLNVVMKLVTNILTDNIQAVRMISNHANPEEMARADRFRDKRVYDKLEGKNVPAPEGRTDRYGSMAEREFKRAKTLPEAKQVYKEDIEPKLRTLPREDHKKEISNLRRNSYQTVPADRKEAERYYQYIRRTQGVDAMVRLSKDKTEQDRVNKAKSRLVR